MPCCLHTHIIIIIKDNHVIELTNNIMLFINHSPYFEGIGGMYYVLQLKRTKSLQLPPSKPDSISIVHTPADPLITLAKHMEYSTSPPSSSMTSKENEIVSALQTVKQNDKNEYSRIKTADYDTTSSDIRYRTTTTAQGITEGGNITVVCTGDVGKPPAKHVFQKYLNGQIVPMQDTVSATSISEMSENCSYYHTSNLTFQVTAKDNNAVIRCVVNSSMEEPDMYVETAPIKVYSVIVVGTVCGSIILVLCVIFFGVLQNKNKTVRCLLRRNRNDRSVDYVNTIQQQDSSLYEGVGHALDVHNYEQLPRREHVYNNANFSDN
ncbi:unnamed protein product [Mytilus coruscus]|uniref:CD80-like immunoglobulin C2-set domain-containing protein n=1 Tax=Mytilus coruscus TaxID=42192 RepID=A0A6J8D8T3_MYTCO|nr:unnamed protein product [Mytilus coruscus]